MFEKLRRRIELRGQHKIQNASLEKVSAFRRDLKINDAVIHTVSQLRGVVKGTEKIGNLSTLTIELNRGQVIRGCARQEWRLASDKPPVEQNDVDRAAASFIQKLQIEGGDRGIAVVDLSDELI